MQSYEHIMAAIIKLSKKGKITLKENLAIMRKYGAYFTYPDSIRALVKLSTNNPFRQPSHMSEGAWMKFVIGKELKDLKNGFPSNKIYIPEGLELKAADGPTDLESALKYNQNLLETEEGQAIYEHLKEDTYTDTLFQKYVATCYIDLPNTNVNLGENCHLYGENTKAGLARLNQTGRVIKMSEFRIIVYYIQQLSTLELFKELRKHYSNITFEQIQETIFSSYNENYPDAMMNAKQYVIPVKEEQERILYSLTTANYEYYENLKQLLVETGAFKNVSDINKQVNDLINKVTFIGNEQNQIYYF